MKDLKNCCEWNWRDAIDEIQ